MVLQIMDFQLKTKHLFKPSFLLGVNNDVWYVVKQSGWASISCVVDEKSYEVREHVYEENRAVLTALFRFNKDDDDTHSDNNNIVLPRDCKDAVPDVHKGFFMDYRHLENQFKFLTNTSGLTSVVEENFKQEMGKMLLLERFLKLISL